MMIPAAMSAMPPAASAHTDAPGGPCRCGSGPVPNLPTPAWPAVCEPPAALPDTPPAVVPELLPEMVPVTPEAEPLPDVEPPPLFDEPGTPEVEPGADCVGATVGAPGPGVSVACGAVVGDADTP